MHQACGGRVPRFNEGIKAISRWAAFAREHLCAAALGHHDDRVGGGGEADAFWGHMVTVDGTPEKAPLVQRCRDKERGEPTMNSGQITASLRAH